MEVEGYYFTFIARLTSQFLFQTEQVCLPLLEFCIMELAGA